MIGRLLLAALLAASAAYAQRGGRGATNPDGSPMNIGFGAPRQTKIEAISSRLKLDKTQKTEVEAILDAAQQEAVPLRDTLSKGREAIALALVDGRTADAEAAESAYAALLAKATGIEASAFSKIYATLKPNQQSRAGQAFELMNGMFQVREPGRGR
jgi:hypothetical protein